MQRGWRRKPSQSYWEATGKGAAVDAVEVQTTQVDAVEVQTTQASFRPPVVVAQGELLPRPSVPAISRQSAAWEGENPSSRVIAIAGWA